MKKLARAFAALLCAALGGVVAVGEPANAALQPSEFERCLSERHSLSVLFLVDTSASLRRTDGNDQRVAGLQVALGALASLRSAGLNGGKQVTTYVDFLSFGTKTTRSFGATRPRWAELGDDSSSLIRDVEQFRQQKTARDTDYVSALEPWLDSTARPADEVGALEMLEAAPAGSCRLLVWFTDGKMEFEPGGGKVLHWHEPPLYLRNYDEAAKTAAAGVDTLCRPDGLADRLRDGGLSDGEGAFTAVVTLGSSNFDLIGRIATGDYNSGTCGRRPARGALFSAKDVNELLLYLRKAILGPDAGPSSGEAGISTCTESCADATGPVQPYDYPFYLSQGIASFNLFTLAGDASIKTELISPSGDSVPLGSAQTLTMSNGVRLAVHEFDINKNAHQVEASLPEDSEAWTGQWRVRFSATDAAAASKLPNRASIYVFGGTLQARVRGNEGFLRKGRTGKIVIDLVNAQGIRAAQPEFAPTPELKLTIGGETIQAPKPAPDGSWTVDYSVPANFSGKELVVEGELTVSAQLDPAANPVILGQWPKSVIGSIEVRDLPKHPVMDDPVVPFEETFNQKQTVIESTLHVDATAQESAGCVTLLSTTPPANGSVTVLLQGKELGVGADCALHLNAGETAELTVRLSVDKKSIVEPRQVVGDLTFDLKGDLDGAQRESITKSFNARVIPTYSRKVDQSTVVWLVLAAVLLPILLLYGFNFLMAKIDLGDGALVAMPVRLRSGALYRLVNGSEAPLTFDGNDLDVMSIPSAGKYRTLDLRGLSISGRMPGSPFGDVFGSAAAEGAAFVVANSGSRRNGSRGRLPASARGAWVFHSPSRPIKDSELVEPLDGTLTMITDATIGDALRSFAQNSATITDTITRSADRHAAPRPPAAAVTVERGYSPTAPPISDTPAVTPPTVVGPIDPLTGRPLTPPNPSPETSTNDTKRRRGKGRPAPSEQNVGESPSFPKDPFAR